MASEPELQYSEPIRAMLLGLGDLPEPSAETVRLTEALVQLRLRRLVTKAGRPVTQESLVRALRSDRRRQAQCALYFLLLRDCSVASAADAEEDGAAAGGLGEELRHSGRRQLPTFVRPLVEDVGEELAQLDSERRQRLRRLGSCTDGMSAMQYQRFSACRRATLLLRRPPSPTSTAPSRPSRADFVAFAEWLAPGDAASVTHDACQLLSFLGHEMVAEIVDEVKRRRSADWPAAAQELDSQICASPSEWRRAVQQLLRTSGQSAS